MHDYLEWLRDVKRLRPSTLRSYRDVLTNFTNHQKGDILDATSADIAKFIRRTRRHGGPPAPATQALDRTILASFYDWALRTGRISVDPMYMVPAPKVPTSPPKAIDDGIWLRLWGSNLSCDDRLWLGLGYFAGLRRFEISTVAPSDFDLTQRTMTFERKGGSLAPVEYGALAGIVSDSLPHLADGAGRWVGLVDAAVKARGDERFLAHWANGRQPHDSSWVNKSTKRVLRLAGMDEGTFTPHALRHSCATNLMRSGVPIEFIADQLSHAHLGTTRRYLRTSGQLARWRQGR